MDLSTQSRAPRFAVQADESQSLHFLREGRPERTTALKVVDISATGLAFYVGKEQAPKAGETIQFDVGVLGLQPRRIQTAKVIRIEDQAAQGGQAGLVKVAVHIVVDPRGMKPAPTENYLGWIVAALVAVCLMIVLLT